MSNDDELFYAEADADAATVGVVKVISDDWSRWHFQSAKDPLKFHTVDLTEWNLSGSCSCEHFDIRIRPLLRDRVIKPHSAESKCKHIAKAERILCYKCKRVLVEQRNNQNKALQPA